jgi:predicted nuclease of predicted toxin-antitoxin system
MKILFDQGKPVPLRKMLSGHKIDTAFECGWQTLENGDLISNAEIAGYELLITTDQNLKYQQVLSDRTISIIVLTSTSWPRI